MLKVPEASNPRRVSVTMLVEVLREQCGHVAHMAQRLEEARVERNEMLIELKQAGVPDARLARLTGMSLSAVTKVTAGARRGSLSL